MAASQEVLEDALLRRVLRLCTDEQHASPQDDPPIACLPGLIEVRGVQQRAPACMLQPQEQARHPVSTVSLQISGASL